MGKIKWGNVAKWKLKGNKFLGGKINLEAEIIFQKENLIQNEFEGTSGMTRSIWHEMNIWKETDVRLNLIGTLIGKGNTFLEEGIWWKINLEIVII